MTKRQKISVEGLIDEEVPGEFHHGDCLGSDEESHKIVRNIGFWRVTIWPPIDPKWRAWCTADVLKLEQPYLKRNRSIMNATSLLIATPKSELEKGGTWYTINFARSRRKRVLIVWPDGEITS